MHLGPAAVDGGTRLQVKLVGVDIFMHSFQLSLTLSVPAETEQVSHLMKAEIDKCVYTVYPLNRDTIRTLLQQSWPYTIRSGWLDGTKTKFDSLISLIITLSTARDLSVVAFCLLQPCMVQQQLFLISCSILFDAPSADRKGGSHRLPDYLICLQLAASLCQASSKRSNTRHFLCTWIKLIGGIPECGAWLILTTKCGNLEPHS